MNNVIEFKSRKVDLFERNCKNNLARFKELNIKYFQDSLTTDEEIELEKLDKWNKIHKEQINNKSRMVN